MSKSAFTSKCEQAKELLLDEIARRGLAKGDRLPSRPDWRKRLGISNDTLDKALRQLIDSGILVATPGRGTFLNQDIRPNPKEGKTRQARIIDVFLPFSRGETPGIASPQVHLRRLDGVAMACRDVEFALSLHFLNAYAFADLDELLRAAGPLHDAAVFFGEDVLARLESHVRAARIPFVVIGQLQRETNTIIPSVKKAYLDLMAHLSAIGRTNLAYVSLDPAAANSHLNTVVEAAKQSGLEPKRVYWVDKDAGPVLERLIERDLPADNLNALLFRNDAMALRALAMLKGRGIRVPEDVVVAGYNDVPEAALAEPPLATIAQPYERSGAVAIEALARMLDTRTFEFPSVTLDAELILRKSALPQAAQ